MNVPMIMRADASRAIGSGHLIRSLALAQAWEAAGGTAIIATAAADEALPAALRGRPIKVVKTPASHPDSSDMEFMRELLGRHPAAWVACDGYHFDAGYTRGLRDAGARVMVVDDIAAAPAYDADVILNQNVFAERFSYACRTATRMLLGPRYALVRREFEPWRDETRERTAPVRRVLVTMGAADQCDQTGAVLRALATVNRRFRVRVVVGPSNPRGPELEALARDAGLQAEFVNNPPSMAPVLAWADVAISAGGSTCYELCYLGVPMLLITLADNQAGITTGLHESGAAIHLGWHHAVGEQQIATCAAELFADPRRRSALGRAGLHLVDGQGGARVVGTLQGTVEPRAVGVSGSR